ncbi:hypothetical protein GCM10012288_05570 [Malaciobacter pacificus]|jgi:nitrous oxide reductase accessory protein NosL|uniref:NosL domain-containing protein n=1 Tax=Malaciobacter pacificus TaxID=1080223 RepID=A0A5C2HAY3_9BACT|nr:nitrous oxide reductase accessory protein NosL [Malaciobacter pacificus]QEP33914.1 NosL domain-containing protein [Malaciobacter pacificus]GGD34499.1 hypothetical protein GCM10012288_05570 [Malaciobacter pacificus]
MYKNKILLILISTILSFSYAQEMFQTVNPKDATLVKSDSSKEFCNVCGMHLTKFYKTNHVTEFKNGHKEQYCSIHCQAKVDEAFKEKIKHVQVVDTNSLELIDAKSAFYVVGSSKKGTMSMVSKYAFLSEKEAKEFQKEFGGEIHNYNEALKIAKDDFKNDDKAINQKRIKVAQKGKKIYESLCKEVSKEFNSIGEAKQYLIDNKVCKNLKPQMQQAVAIYLYNPLLAVDKNKIINVPADAKCPVCGMFVAKYPKWVASINIKEAHTHYFDGVKDMMKFYFNPSKFAHNHSKDEFKDIKVTDYYTLNAISAKEAFYVIGSNIYGPMGEELIPFVSKEKAQKFLNDHFGKKVLKFEEIKESMLY